MIANVIRVLKARYIPKTDIPNGVYKGIWDSTKARFTINDNKYILQVDECNRGFPCPCTITVMGEKVTVSTGEWWQ